ncbi:MAG TPA: hypothetical protein DHU16_00625, partial [Gammaproteobacteria bacterium]|nr:hypothetical protein [Gammaproteobacteria bacterium]
MKIWVVFRQNSGDTVTVSYSCDRNKRTKIPRPLKPNLFNDVPIIASHGQYHAIFRPGKIVDRELMAAKQQKHRSIWVKSPNQIFGIDSKKKPVGGLVLRDGKVAQIL